VTADELVKWISRYWLIEEIKPDKPARIYANRPPQNSGIEFGGMREESGDPSVGFPHGFSPPARPSTSGLEAECPHQLP
jgi:hypothetical protein